MQMNITYLDINLNTKTRDITRKVISIYTNIHKNV